MTGRHCQPGSAATLAVRRPTFIVKIVAAPAVTTVRSLVAAHQKKRLHLVPPLQPAQREVADQICAVAECLFRPAEVLNSGS